MRRTGKRRPGFTLIEVIIAVCVLALGLSTIFALFPIGIMAVKEVVDGTRAAMLADTARAELVISKVHLGIANRGSSYFDGEWCNAPAGSICYPVDLRYFASSTYEFTDSSGAQVKRVLFDDERMVPLRLKGTFDGGNTVTVAPHSVTRDAERLAYFVTAGSFAPWEILLRTGGRIYTLDSCSFNGVTPDILTIDPLGASLPVSSTPADFEILIPVAMREPGVRISQTSLRSTADFSVWNPYPLNHSLDAAGTFSHVCPGGWISVNGDWFRVTDVTDEKITLDSAQPQPPAAMASFEVVLPVVDYSLAVLKKNDPGTGEDDSLYMPILTSGSATAGRAADLAYLESGAYVEVVLDGAIADFDPGNPSGRRTVTNVVAENLDTAALISPGNFIRTFEGDWQIETTFDTVSKSFELAGSVPGLGDGRYFNVVLGFLPGAGQVPRVARFPVVSVTRDKPAAPGGVRPIIGFEVGCDGNGNLPSDFLPIGPGAMAHPVHIVPKNHSPFSYQVALSQRSIKGDIRRNSPWVEAPEQAAPSPKTPAVPPVPFPIDDDVCATFNPVHVSSYRIFIPPAGKDLNPNWMSNYAVKRDVVDTADGGAKLKIHPHPPFSGDNVSFYIWDRNLIAGKMYVGEGVYSKTDKNVTFTVLNENAPFMSPGVYLNCYYVDNKGKSQIETMEIPEDFDPLTGTLEFKVNQVDSGTIVSIYIAPSSEIGPPNGNPPRGRGRWIHGSNIVRAVYPNTWPGVASPGAGFPASRLAGARVNLEIGDYVEPPDGGNWYTVVSMQMNGGFGSDYLVLDRPYTGPTDEDFSFRYTTTLNKTYNAQISIFRNYSPQPLWDSGGPGSKGAAAAFGYDADGNDHPRKVQLAVPLPQNVKAGDFIRAEGDMATYASGPDDKGVATMIEPGLGDDSDGDMCWYMIDSISADRLELTITCDYLGYIPPNDTPPGQSKSKGVFQPASVTSSVVDTFDTMIGEW